MRQLSFKGVLSTTLLGLWVFFKTSCGQSVCQPCEFQTNVSTSEISISVCNYEFLNDFASEPRIFTLNLTCPTDCCTSPGNDSQPLLMTFPGLTPGNQYSFNILIDNETDTKIVYTKPERVSPEVSNRGTTDYIEVTWMCPPGNVEEYLVNLTSNFGDNLTKFLNSSFQSHVFSGLTAGRNYTVIVTTISGPFAEESEPVSTATYPNPPGAIHVEEQTTDSITISWGWPQGMDWGQYSFIIFYQDHPNGQTLTSNRTVLVNLTSGTLYNISVVTVGPMKYQSTAITAELYTKPERVSPVVSNRGTTDTIEVTWTSPPGNVEEYLVNLTSNFGDNLTKFVKASFQSHVFSGLTAGRNYTVIVTTISGPFAEESEPVSTATYPNPPGAIHAEVQTTDSITISWGWPQGMDWGQYSFIIFYQDHPNGQTLTSNRTVLVNLTSGTLYNISVVTVGPMNYQSTAITAELYTRPYPVLGLNATTINTTVVVLHWQRPQGYQPGYSFRVETSGCMPVPRNQIELDSMATVSGLPPGTNFSFTVYSQVQNSIEGEPISVYQYTKPERVSPEVSNRGTTDIIEVTWTPPLGNVEEYMVHLTSNFEDNQTKFFNGSFQSHLFSGLTAGRNYTVIVTTISGPFAEESEPVSTATYPNPPGAIHVEEQTTDSITISWGWPQDMDWGQYSFIIFYQDHPNGQTLTSNTTVLVNLTSGTLYNISVVTVGPMNYQSTAITAELYTNPNPPGAIHVEEHTTDSITISWGWPQDMDWGQYSFIIFYQDHPNGQTLTSNRTVLANLTSGTLYNISLVTVGPMNYKSTAVTAEIYTRPYPVLGLNATTINTTVVVLHWQRPQGYQPGYSFRVETSGCMPVPRNQIELDSMATVTGLPPGTNFSFTVYSQVQNSIEGEPISVYQYTKPERVNPEVSNRGTTDTIEVTWTPPLGNVEKHMINLTSNFGDNQTKFFNGSFQSHLFSGLTAGRNYTVIVTTISGPFAEESEPVSTATYPNPPGAIHAEEQTTDSITISWGWPQGMDWGQYSFIIFYQDHPNGQTLTSNTTVLVNLTSGTLYNISLVTIGPMNYQSTTVTAEIYTRPYPVLGLNATTINTTVVLLHWQRPQGYQPGYSYRVVTSGCTSAPRTQIEENPMVTITGLNPGTNCSFTIYSQVQSAIEGEPISVYQYTKPERVSPVVSNRGTTDTIEVTWTSPPGNVEEYMVHLTGNFEDDRTKFLNSSFQSHLFSGLTAGRNYTVTVTTISGPFAEESEPVSTATYPNPPGAIHAEEQTTDSITISWGWPQGMDWGQYSFIIFYQDHPNGQTLTSNTTVLVNLTSGTLYNISLVTIGPMNYQSTTVTAEIYTRPYPVLGLNAITINTTVVLLHWQRPQGYQPGYSYRVVTSGCTSAPRTQIEENPMVTITGLNPGTNCSFTIYTQVQSAIEGEPISVYQYTKPERVSPVVSNRGTTDTIEVTWTSPPGNVEEYLVHLTGNFEDDRTKFLNSSFQSHLFSGLTAGRNYTVTVTTISGPFAEESEPVSTATYPNPPGAIHAEMQTSDSITISWGWPQDMDWGQHSFIIFYQDHPNGQTLTSNTTVLANLTSGTLYNISLVTIGPMNYQSTAVTAELYTRPYPVLGLNATTINTMVVVLHWQRPQGYQPGYSYRVETSGCTSAPQTQIEENSMATITGLNPGTNCSFTVYTQVQSAIEGEPISVYQYTKPERVSPVVSNRGTTDTIEVTWTSPPGNVEEYRVNLTGNFEDDRTKFLNSSFQKHLFSGLTAGRNYTVTVTTISGPFAEESEPVSTATYPNAPGPITVTRKTTKSLTIEWIPSPAMDNDSFFYHVIYSSSAHDRKSIDTRLKELILVDLASGTPYYISVATVGLFQFTSQPVNLSTTTRPESIQDLKLRSTTVDKISITWQRPVGFKVGYSYNVRARNSTSHLIKDENTQNLYYEFMGLVPGNSYDLTVTSQTSDRTEGSPLSISNCTDASPVLNLKCDGPNHADAVLLLMWDRPEGSNQGFRMTWTDTRSVNLPACGSDCSYNIENLSYHTQYTVKIWTLGCGRSSGVHNAVCQTGITVPPVPNLNAGIYIVKAKHNQFAVKFNSSLLNGINGPIVAYGVLVTSQGFSDEHNIALQRYLNNTYDDWKEDNSVPYLATARDVDDVEAFRYRSDKSELEVDIGSGSKWNGYENGPLKAKTTYRFAFVMFTHLVLKKGLIDLSESLLSVSPFHQNNVALPENPTVITAAAVGGALAALACLTGVSGALLAYRRKAAKKKTTEIPIQSMSAKIAVPVRVEDYEAYHKKQSADSNCGFAAEYEDLKSVGLAQSRVSAEASENKGKNRYGNVLPYDSTRVKLSIHGSPYDDYINASYVPGYNCRKEFIAAQGPLPGTVDEFWRMLWEKNVHTLVMLTRCTELGRVKCEEYWPSQTKHFKNITVTTTSVIPLEDWTIRDFDVKNVKTAETRSLRQFHFTAWPDHGVPDSTELLINFRHLVREHMDQFSRNSPTVVHCSAGVGRTGTMIALDHLIFQIERESMVDVFGIVHDMRMHRTLMVQAEAQYVYLHQCALDVIRSRTGTNVDLIYQNTAAFNIYENFTPVKGDRGVPGP